MLIDPNLIKQIFIKDFDYFTNKRQFEFGNKYLDNALFLLQGERWRKARHASTPVFTSGKLKKMSNIVFQSELAVKLQHHPKSTSPEKLLFSTANQALCDGLKNISEICYTKLLNQCYDAHDAYFHYMHMIEELKTAGILLAMHLLPIHANSNNVDILKCQVFQENSPFQNNSQVVVALAVVVSFLLLGK